MPATAAESGYRNPYSIPENHSFGTWLARDPYLFRLARRDSPHVQRVIRLVDRRSVFARDPEYLTHEHRLALTLRYVREAYPSEEEIFERFGINRRTLATFTAVAHEPRMHDYYNDMQRALLEMQQRRQKRQRERVSVHANGRRKAPTQETLRELAGISTYNEN